MNPSIQHRAVFWRGRILSKYIVIELPPPGIINKVSALGGTADFLRKVPPLFLARAEIPLDVAVSLQRGARYLYLEP